VKVNLLYFKQSGKYYSEAQVFIPGVTFYWDAIDVLRNDIANGNLHGLTSKKWPGVILANFKDGPPYVLQGATNGA